MPHRLLNTSKGLRLAIDGIGELSSVWDNPRDVARIQRANRRNEGLLRAIAPRMNNAERASWEVVDATAGLGRDTALLLAAGYQVSAIEQHPQVQLLLADAVERWQLNLPVIRSEACRWLRDHPNSCDSVYLDPMYPQRRQKALVRKGMQGLQALLGASNEQQRSDLLIAATLAARHRVIFKRPSDIPALTTAELKVHHVIDAGQVQFDVYDVA